MKAPKTAPVGLNPGELVLPTGGTCMRPWIWPHGHLIVRECSPGELKRGDIAVWFDGRRLLSHRVINTTRGEITTRADSHRSTDPPVAWSQVVGRAVAFERGPIRYRLDSMPARLLGLLVARPMPRVRWAATRIRLAVTALVAGACARRNT